MVASVISTCRCTVATIWPAISAIWATIDLTWATIKSAVSSMECESKLVKKKKLIAISHVEMNEKEVFLFRNLLKNKNERKEKAKM
jgi:hypothetical protein